MKDVLTEDELFFLATRRYGSECHIFRYLGRHRDRLDAMIRGKIGADAVRWLGFHFDPTKRWLDWERNRK